MKQQKNPTYNSLYQRVYGYKTKHSMGYTSKEMQEVINSYPELDKVKFEDAMMGNTGAVIDGEFLTYHVDVLNGLLAGLGQSYTWD